MEDDLNWKTISKYLNWNNSVTTEKMKMTTYRKCLATTNQILLKF